MTPSNVITVQFVADEGLCNGCGTCAAACPEGSISIVESFTGLLLAGVDKQSCTLCGICTEVCSATHVSLEVFNPLAGHFSGSRSVTFCGQAKENKVRENGQSGGVVTALVSYLLESKQVSRALLTGHGQNPLRPVPVIIDSSKSIGPTQSSRYCPVALNTELNRIDDFDRLAYVGLSCHIRGLHNYLARSGGKNGRPVIIGLFCDSVLSYKAIDFLISDAINDASEVNKFRYKDKRFGPYPGNCVIETKDGEQYQVPNSKRLFAKELLKPPYCFLCHDKLNMYSDVSFGDSWGLGSKYQGKTVAICWTERGRKFMDEAAASGYLDAEIVEFDQITEGQDIIGRENTWRTSMALWNKAGRYLPRYGPPIPGEYFSGSGHKKAKKRFLRSMFLFSAQTPHDFENMFMNIVHRNQKIYKFKAYLSTVFEKFRQGTLFRKKV